MGLKSRRFGGPNHDVDITANFARIRTLNVSYGGAGTGTVSPKSGSFADDTIVNFTITPAAGSYFSGWSGEDAGDIHGSGPYHVHMDENITVTANFGLSTYTLSTSVDPSGAGSVARNPSQSEYNYGDEVELTATANDGYRFVGWSGHASGTSETTSVTMNGNRIVVANFEENFTLSVSVEGNGHVSADPDQDFYGPGDVVDLTATADPGWSFAGWSGDTGGTSATTSVTMNDDRSVTATFTEDEYILNVNVGDGSVSKSPDEPHYHYGNTVNLTATADAGWHFSHWGSDLEDTSTTKSVTMYSNETLTAVFEQDEYTLTVNTSGHGNVSPNGGVYLSFTDVTLTASAPDGWAFSHWTGDAEGNGNPIRIEMTGDKTVTAVFRERGDGALSVTAVKSDGTDVAGLSVKISGSLSATIHTNASGKASLNGLWAGTYKVDISASGYTSNGPKTIVLETNTDTGSATITLTPVEEEPIVEIEEPIEEPQQPAEEPVEVTEEPVEEPTQEPVVVVEVPEAPVEEPIAPPAAEPTLPSTGADYTVIMMLGIAAIAAGYGIRRRR